MKLNLLVIRVADLAKSRAFYEALGLSFHEERHGSGPIQLAAKLDGSVLELYPMTSSSLTTIGARFGLLALGIEGIVDRALTAGGSLVTAAADSPWGRRAVVADPDGHKIELTEDDEVPW